MNAFHVHHGIFAGNQGNLVFRQVGAIDIELGVRGRPHAHIATIFNRCPLHRQRGVADIDGSAASVLDNAIANFQGTAFNRIAKLSILDMGALSFARLVSRNGNTVPVLVFFCSGHHHRIMALAHHRQGTATDIKTRALVKVNLGSRFHDQGFAFGHH